MNRIKYIICVVFGALLFLAGCSGDEEIISMSGSLKQAEAQSTVSVSEDSSNSGSVATGDDIKSAAADSESSIFVFICGAISKPGVYEMPEGSRVYELINRAGGITSDGAVNSVNQAETLQDSQQVYIPRRDEVTVTVASGTLGADTPGAAGQGALGKALININTADETTLQQINGIGASRAADIVAYRNTNGSFEEIEDIMKVPGIKNGLFSRIKDQISVR